MKKIENNIRIKTIIVHQKVISILSISDTELERLKELKMLNIKTTTRKIFRFTINYQEPLKLCMNC